jgi:hypothetical protein
MELQTLLLLLLLLLLLFNRDNSMNYTSINPLKLSGNYMYHLIYQSVTVHSVFMGFVSSLV